ncbi:MAG: ABC transporter ATP-binding protein [Synergistaceae bacterium]|jgi:ABC-type lipoprotein export system ATPase subunit|nr:ABC transporter ATP-binding protein [Synergistaceae bacterium]
MNTQTPPFLEIRNLRHSYSQPVKSRVQALSLDHMSAAKGEAVAVVGPSGSGKTTLLHILAALICPTGGEVLFGGRDIFAPHQSGALWRAESVGYIFQEMNLMPGFSALENILLAAEISNVPGFVARERANSLLQRLDLWNQRNRRPAELSLGEQQRAAVARAVVHSPSVILADEPTASLDAENAGIVMNILTKLCAESQTLLIIATHDEAVKTRFERVVQLQRPQKEAI